MQAKEPVLARHESPLRGPHGESGWACGETVVDPIHTSGGNLAGDSDAGVPAYDVGAGAFVWSFWLVLVAAALLLVAFCSSPIPLWDDYLAMPQITGFKPVTADWLWSVHYNHRIPLPKLLFVALGRLGHYDLRVGMYFNVLALAALAAALLGAVRVARGGWVFADGFIPLLLLQYGHHRNMMWFWQVSAVTPIVLAGTLLVLIVRSRGRLTVPSSLLFGVILLTLPLCGALGLAFVPPMALWLGYMGLRAWREHGGRRRATTGLIAGGSIAVALGIVGLYFVQYHEPSVKERLWQGWTTIRPMIRTSVQFLSTAFGHLPEKFFPTTGPMAGGVVVLGLLSAVVTWVRVPSARAQVLGIVLFLSGAGIVMAGVGWGRSTEAWNPSEGLDPRYVTMAVPAFLAAYFLGCYFPFRAAGRFGQMALFLALCALAPFSTQMGLNQERFISAEAQSFEKEIGSGVPVSILVDRYLASFYFLDRFHFRRENMIEGLEDLRERGVPLFRHLQSGPELESIDIALRAEQESDSGGPLTPDGMANSSAIKGIRYHLPGPRYVGAVQVDLLYLDPKSDEVECSLAWGTDDQSSMALTGLQDERVKPYRPRPKTATFWVDATIDQFLLKPVDHPQAFRITAVRILVPVPGNAAGAKRPDEAPP